jgi:bacterioferritin-associated ferredoxin
MILCLCEGIDDQTVRHHARRGCLTVRELGRSCGAGRDCGACVADLKQVLEACREELAGQPEVALQLAAK